MAEALAQTVLQMGMTNYQPLRSYVVRAFPLRTLYRRYTRQLRKFCYAFLPRDSYAKRGICRRGVCVFVSVCHTPVLYLNG